MSALARTLCEISARSPSGTAAEPFGIVFLAGPDQPLRDFIEYALRPAKRDSENSENNDADINNNINGDSDGENITSPVENENKNENETENKNETETKEIKNEKSENQRFYNIYNTGRTETAEVLAFYRIEPEKI